MMVRRYIVKDMPEAVSLIRKDLGKDAVILSTKRIRVKKWLGLWRSPRIEVMAAVGADIPVRAPSTQFRDVARELEKFAEKAQAGTTSSLLSTVNHLTASRAQSTSEVLENFTDLATQEVSTAAFVSMHAATPLSSGVRSDEATMAEIASTTATPPVHPTVEWESVLSELSDVKRMLGDAIRSQPASTATMGLATMSDTPLFNLLGQAQSVSSNTEFVEEILGRLRLQGVNASLVDWVYAELKKVDLKRESLENSEVDAKQSELYSWAGAVHHLLLNQFTGLKMAQPIASTSRVVAFVGPTGVGKTTTIAKLAALHVLTGKRTVGLVTADTFRIAAVEQLKTYATILNVPLEVVGEGDSLQTAIQRLSHCDLLLIDTAGRNYFDFECMQGIQKLFSDVVVDETYLVLSLTSKIEDLELLASLFHRMKIDKFLFTKMDETSSYGAVLNLLQTYNKPLSYISTGQNVPDDIEVASLESIIRAVVGGAV